MQNLKLVIENRSLWRRCDFFIGRRLNWGNCDVQFYTIWIIHICIRIPYPFSRTMPCNNWVNCSIFALLTRTMNTCLTFRCKVSHFWGIQTYTSTVLFHTCVSLKPETWNLKPETWNTLQYWERSGDKTCTSSSLCVGEMRNSFTPFRAFVVHPISGGQEKWLLKLLPLALLAVNWKLVMMPWTCGRWKILNVSFC